MGNTPVLRETALVEAFNLKAAIEFNTKNLEAAREALSDMPPRGEDEVRLPSLTRCIVHYRTNLPALASSTAEGRRPNLY